jgi:hypothetical protein
MVARFRLFVNLGISRFFRSPATRSRHFRARRCCLSAPFVTAASPRIALCPSPGRAVDYSHRNLLKILVADAVGIEPVSASKFPANREKNREFRRIRASLAFFVSNRPVHSATCRQIPYSTEQGIISMYQGNSFEEQGSEVAVMLFATSCAGRRECFAASCV